MLVTKEEFKALDIKSVFESGNNFIKIKDGKHAIYHVNGKYQVVESDKLYPTKRIPKYIKTKLA
ncbi:hypothetical protein GZH82_05740 [Staphylococcus ursi]|uniref:hypothetical protein n=1 Tax=Staphylococcus sp. MI 10-1553 TaxID=1912064 RepID=UPI0013976016|nr:hypothetical protein [Staphylococcus sp. MI 10-1553]QHW36864.1 hypothetical protein GZH82_05740 [Staphylococcus sp. MI 10-1553]